MIEYVGTHELKRDHAGPDAPLKILLKEPQTWVTYNKPALPSNVVF